MWQDAGHGALVLLERKQNPNPYATATAYAVRPIIPTAISGASTAVRGAVNRIGNALGAAAAASAIASPYNVYSSDGSAALYVPGAYATGEGAFPTISAPPQQNYIHPVIHSAHDYYLTGMSQHQEGPYPPYAQTGAATYPVYVSQPLLSEVAHQAANGVAGVAGLATHAFHSVAGMASQAAHTATQGVVNGLQAGALPWNEAISIAERFVVPSIEAIAKAAPAISLKEPHSAAGDQHKRLRSRGASETKSPDSPRDPNAPPMDSVPEKKPRLYVSQVGNATAVQ
ncbi:hypothetical protein CSUI_010373 [Cystoisospora suis]|uniref:Uncharacterized protein n=1 Tax=Cystoisospora suis TaxID=483139 RepID=A0A2C6KHK7_9APIC|nr:hypothetical protein CSUI_010373 [Cystoisospora suis]